VGPYISAIEHSAIEAPYLIKGIDLKQRVQKMQTLKQFDYFLEIDYSRFDMSISYEILSQFEWVWLTEPFQSEEHLLFRTALALALTTKGVSELGIRYVLAGGRCSGDAHTSIGNGILNRFMTWICLKKLPIDVWTMFCEGDDAILGVTAEYKDAAIQCLEVLKTFGFQIKMDVCNGISTASFCGMFLYGDCQLGMYSDFYRTFAKIHTVCSNGNPRTLAVAKCLSYLALNPSTPILTEFCLMILRCLDITRSQLKRGVSRMRADKSMPYYVNQTKNRILEVYDCTPMNNIRPDCRAAFAMRTGLSPSTQVRFENYYKSLTYIPDQFDQVPYDVTYDGPGSHIYFGNTWSTK